jgi:hypothetical protein
MTVGRICFRPATTVRLSSPKRNDTNKRTNKSEESYSPNKQKTGSLGLRQKRAGNRTQCYLQSSPLFFGRIFFALDVFSSSLSVCVILFVFTLAVAQAGARILGVISTVGFCYRPNNRATRELASSAANN